MLLSPGKLFVKISCLVLTAVLLAGSMPSVSHASKTTAQQIKDKENEKENLEDRIEQNEEELKGLKGEHKSLKAELQDLNRQLTEVTERLADLEQQIIDKEAEIAQTQADLDQAREKEAWQYDCMEKRIQMSYEKMGTNFISALLSAESFADILNLANYVASIVKYDNQQLDEIIENREYIESEEARLEQENEELKLLQLQAEAQQSMVNDLIDQTSSKMASYADQIEDAEKEAKEYEAAMKALEDDLETLKKKLAEEIRLSQQAASGTWRDISEVSFAEGDLKLLANLIYCEAGGEPYEGKLAVGAVVINRVRSEKFPGTVVGVIYQKNQFSPVKSGRLDMYLAINKANADCYRAAQEAMAGYTNVGNCLFFRTPIEGLVGINIGGHVFY